MVGDMLGLTRLSRTLLFPRHLVAAPRPPSARGLERLFIETASGKVEAWLLPGDGVSAARPGPVVVFAHGNGELIDHWPDMLEPYRRLGVSVVLPEYRGYGRSAGRPSEVAIVEDCLQLLEMLKADARLDLQRLVYHGRSIGGGVACALTRKHAPRALVLESTFTSIVDVARGMGIPAFLIFDNFENLKVVKDFTGPILVMHGTRDRLVPVAHSKRLAAENPKAELRLYDVAHNDLPPAGSDYWQRVEATLQRANLLGT